VTREVDEQVHALLVLMPRLVGRAKRRPPPAQLAGYALTPRHLALFAVLLDGPMSVNQLAETLDLAATTVSLVVGDLSRQGLLTRTEDAADRRRKLISLAGAHRAAIDDWLGGAAAAWRRALDPLTVAERRLFVDTLTRFERSLGGQG
jgi:DNA-binding MarR family transcriptional regulator